MYEEKYVLFRERPHKTAGAIEQYWRGFVGKRLNELTTQKLTKAKQFDTYEEALAVVNTLVNKELLPPAMLDMRIGRRIITDDTNLMCAGTVSLSGERQGVPGFKSDRGPLGRAVSKNERTQT